MKRLDRRWLAPALCLACLALQTPVHMLADMLFSGISMQATADYLSVMFIEAVLWLLPALLLLPWKTRKLGSRADLLPVMLLSLPMGMLLQWGVACIRLWLPMLPHATMPAPQTPGEWLLAVLALAAAPALCEEAFFRGGLLSHLRDVTSPAAAFGLCTLTFALMHGSLSGLLSHLLVSAACTLVMLNTGRVLPAMLLHLGYNAMALLTMWLPVTPWFSLVLLAPAALLGLLTWRMRWKSSEKHLSRTDAVLMVIVLIGCALRYLPLF